MKKIWDELGMTREDWWKLAGAFYSLAHNDFKEFLALRADLRATAAGELCSRYIETGEHDLVEQAGRLITGSKHWYTYLGRIM